MKIISLDSKPDNDTLRPEHRYFIRFALNWMHLFVLGYPREMHEILQEETRKTPIGRSNYSSPALEETESYSCLPRQWKQTGKSTSD